MDFRFYGWLNRRNHKKGEKLAYADDPEYKRIEDLRNEVDKDRDLITISNDKVGLTVALWKYQLDKVHEYAPETRLQKICGWIDAKRLYSWRAFYHTYYKYPKQRAKRGFSDYDTYGLHVYLAKVISDSVQQLRDNLHGWPGDPMTFEEWQETLDKIIAGFKAAVEIDEHHDLSPAAEKILRKQFKDGSLLFQKYFFHLWD